jgi:hypothetical protein
MKMPMLSFALTLSHSLIYVECAENQRAQVFEELIHGFCHVLWFSQGEFMQNHVVDHTANVTDCIKSIWQIFPELWLVDS